jgi:hypothetical protein
VRATNSGGVITETIQPLNVTPFCLQSFTVTPQDSMCGTTCVGPFYVYNWTVQSSSPGTVRVMEKVIDSGWIQVGMVPLSPSTFITDIPNEYDSNGSEICNPSQHQIFVTVNGVEVASPIRNLPGLSTGSCVIVT